MKTRYIKKFIPVAALTLLMGTTSCLNDLDVAPIDPDVSLEFVQDEVFAKIYATMALTGQRGADGSGDVDGVDEGTSGFYRLLWNLNQLPSDETICAWADPGVPELNTAKWSSLDKQLQGMYGRLFFDVTLCNHFLEQTAGLSDSKTAVQRAEVRFMRALNYFYLLDFFGNVPLALTVSSEAPAQASAAEIFAFIERELDECEAEMSEPMQSAYGRADKAANWMLRARLLLNAEVYTGTARWSDAATYAEKVLNTPYSLSPVYAHLFMADNHGSSVNQARNEIILPIASDGIYTKSWATTFYMIASTRQDGMNDSGLRDGWAGNRARKALVEKFFENGEIPAGADLRDLSTLGDERAMFFAEDRTVTIEKMTEFKQGLSVEKFTNLRADGAEASDPVFPDTDVPFFRLAEAKLIFAEATLRAGGNSAAALAEVNELRTRANAEKLTNITLDEILDEKSREFYFEGQRRTDLIRYGYFGGSNYLWDWKGGSPKGTSFASHYNLFPIPQTELTANEKLTQNPGY